MTELGYKTPISYKIASKPHSSLYRLLVVTDDEGRQIDLKRSGGRGRIRGRRRKSTSVRFSCTRPHG